MRFLPSSTKYLFRKVVEVVTRLLLGMLHEAAVGKLEHEMAMRRVLALLTLAPEVAGLPGLTPLLSAETLLAILVVDPSALERLSRVEPPHLHA